MISIQKDFKTIQLAVYFTDIDDEDTRVYRFLLPKLLISHTNKLINRQMMSEKLEDLYGAYFNVSAEHMANLNVISLVMTFVDPKIVNDPQLLDEALSLFNDVLFEHEFFSPEIFEEEKRMLIEQWETLKDRKRHYANTRFFEIFFGDDLYGYPMSGKLKDIKKVTVDQLFEYYQKVFLNNMKKVIVNGHLENNDMAKINNVLVKDMHKDIPFVTKFRKSRDVKIVKEKTNMKQAIIKIGYHFPIFRNDDLYHASVLLETILGGYPDSRLFKEIRERLRLCYDISTNYDYYKGVLMISSGVASEKNEIAVEEIKKQVNLMILHGITEVELAQAKAYFIHQVKSSLDNQSVLTKRTFIRDLLDDHETIEDKIISISKVSSKDVETALSQLTLDTIYVLHGGVKND
jgi:predicted Zn-dependent peptidase